MFIFTLCRCFSWKSTRKSSTLTYLFCWFCSFEYLWKACIKYLYQDYHLHHMGLFCQVFSYGGKNIHKRSLESCSNPCLSSSKISVSHFARVVNGRVTLRVLRGVTTNPYYIHYRCWPIYMTGSIHLIHEIFGANVIRGKGRITVQHASYYQRD